MVRHDGTPIILTLGRPRWEIYTLEFGLTYMILKKKKKKEDESIEGFELLNKNYLPFTVVHTFFFQHMKDSGKRLSISDSRHSKTVCMCVHMYVLHFFLWAWMERSGCHRM